MSRQDGMKEALIGYVIGRGGGPKRDPHPAPDRGGLPGRAGGGTETGKRSGSSRDTSTVTRRDPVSRWGERLQNRHPVQAGQRAP
jgi:hypothetical protein